MRQFALVVCVLSWTGGVVAADEPLYAPVAEWVQEIQIAEDPTPAGEAPLTILLWDQQARADSADLHAYMRTVVRIDTPQGLMGLNTLSALWQPQFQTLTIHEVTIHRGQEIIDVLGHGQRFTVLRRENNLEYAMLDGMLTATLQPEGLWVGDTVSFAYTVTGTDPALEGMVQGGLAAPPIEVEQLSLLASWDESLGVRWRATGVLGASAHESRNRGVTTLKVELERFEPYFPPSNAPNRYMIGPYIELSSLDSWQEVSARIAPLYERAMQLPPDSAVQEEIDRIRSEYDSTLERASAALRMVQDEVRYLFLSLDEGGLVPASAEQTWARRFGDCKGKTALLLAMLHGLGVEASPVLVSSAFGDALPDRLPTVGAFNHVIVRAKIDGKTYWLDGARSGDRAIERVVTPLFHWGLPVQAEGEGLVEIRPAPLETPDTRIALHLDFSAGLAAPGDVEGTIVLRGDAATFTQQAVASLPRSQANQMLQSIWATLYPAAEIDSVAGSRNPSSGEYTLTMTGTVSSRWDSGRYRSITGDFIFLRDVATRPRVEDQAAPYGVQFPYFDSIRETLTLPQDGRGFSAEGEDIETIVAGFEIRRSVSIEGPSVTILGSSRSLVSEISAEEMSEAKERLADLTSQQLYITAPADDRVMEEE